jgi:hypothetical protein
MSLKTPAQTRSSCRRGTERGVYKEQPRKAHSVDDVTPGREREIGHGNHGEAAKGGVDKRRPNHVLINRMPDGPRDTGRNQTSPPSPVAIPT